MLYAQDEAGVIIEATPQAIGFCRGCQNRVIPKCGEIKEQHWAHYPHTDCIYRSEPESLWHIGWKRKVPPFRCEVYFGKHIADIIAKDTKTNSDIVIELQHSSISTTDVRKREDFYKKMIWLFDASPFDDNMHFRKQNGNNGSKYYTFRWKHPHKTIWYMSKPIYFDFRDGHIFLLKKIYHNIPCGGWGYFMKQDEFLDQYFSMNEDVIEDSFLKLINPLKEASI